VGIDQKRAGDAVGLPDGQFLLEWNLTVRQYLDHPSRFSFCAQKRCRWFRCLFLVFIIIHCIAASIHPHAYGLDALASHSLASNYTVLSIETALERVGFGDIPSFR
jgi:hypothetical protein